MDIHVASMICELILRFVSNHFTSRALMLRNCTEIAKEVSFLRNYGWFSKNATVVEKPPSNGKAWHHVVSCSSPCKAKESSCKTIKGRRTKARAPLRPHRISKTDPEREAKLMQKIAKTCIQGNLGVYWVTGREATKRGHMSVCKIFHSAKSEEAYPKQRAKGVRVAKRMALPKNGEFENPKMKGGSLFQRSMTEYITAGAPPPPCEASVERLGCLTQRRMRSAFEAHGFPLAGSSIKGSEKQSSVLSSQENPHAPPISSPAAGVPHQGRRRRRKFAEFRSSRAFQFRLPGRRQSPRLTELNLLHEPRGIREDVSRIAYTVE
nr:hypothetical protein Iba_chr12aCG3040 [Ipomoea batatas]